MTASDLSQLPDRARTDLFFWQRHLAPLLARDKVPQAMLKELAASIGRTYSVVKAKYYAVRNANGNWSVLIDSRLLGPQAWNTRNLVGISEADKSLIRRYCENNQRGNEAAIRELLRDWRNGKVTTSAPLDPRTGYPSGWSLRNLSRYAPTKFELKATRIGRSAAASERQLVYTTRAGLWVGSHYLFDDMWHDHFVNHLDQRKSGRPLEFHGLDLYSANKFAWGMRVRTENEATGKMEHLKEADMRFLLAMVLGNFGYSERGTWLVVERGTAAVSEELEALLYDETRGLIQVSRNGMDGAAAHSGQYAGRAKGNFRFKAALESLGNLIHNEMAALPGQVGKDVDHRPEQMHGLLKYNDALLAALSQLSPERAAMLQWPLLTLQQFRVIAAEIYARINARTDHDLEGWDMHYVPDRQIPGKMRRLSPSEVYRAGARELIQLSPRAVAMILGLDNRVERTTRRGIFEFSDGEISGDVLRYEARHLPEGEKFSTVLNPYQPGSLWCFDAKGRFVAECPRITAPSRGDIEAVQQAMGKARAIETERLQPLRERHLAEARQKLAMHRHNAEVVGGKTEEEKQADRAAKRAANFGRALTKASTDDVLDASDFIPVEDWSDDTPTDRDTEPPVEDWR